MPHERNDRLAGQVLVVSGGGSVGEGVGNGRAMAVLAAREGAAVAVVDFDTAAAETTAAVIREEGGRAHVVTADVSTVDDTARVAREVIEAFGRIDLLANNVGVQAPRGTAVDVDPLEWDRAFEINVRSMMLMSKVCIPHMIEAGGGAIVNVASVAGLLGGSGVLAYPASKGAVVNMTRAMAVHHGADGIRVNCVAPGAVLTPRVEARGLSEEARVRRQHSSLLPIEGTAWDVGEAALFLLSPRARWITGVILPVDGGWTSTYATQRASITG